MDVTIHILPFWSLLQCDGSYTDNAMLFNAGSVMPLNGLLLKGGNYINRKHTGCQIFNVLNVTDTVYLLHTVAVFFRIGKALII